MATIADPGGSGEYIVSVSAVGYRFARRRVVNDDGAVTLRVSFILAPDTGQRLAAVVVRANRSAVERRFIYEIPPGNVESVTQGTNASAPAVIASFEELLRNNPMFDGVGAAGAAATESQTQLNGLLFTGNALPRSTPVVVRGTVAEYDASIAGFSGGRIAADVSAAGEYVSRTGGTTIDLRQHSRHRLGGAAGLPISPAYVADVGGTTLLRDEKLGLSWGVRARATSDPTSSLETADSAFLASLGVSAARRDAIEELSRDRGLWQPVRLPRSSLGIAGSSIARVDFDRRPSSTNALVATLSLDARQNFLDDPLVGAGFSRGNRTTDLALQHLWERTLQSQALWRSRSGVSLGLQRGVGVETLGTAAIRVVPILDTEIGLGAPTLSLGGALPAARRDRFVLEHQVEREQRVGPASAHQLKVFAQARLHGAQFETDGPMSTVEFATLSAYQSAGDAAVRVATLQDTRATALRLSGGVNDAWRITSRLRSSGGIRVDYQRVALLNGTSPYARSVVDISPRVGFTWSLVEPKTGAGFGTTNLLRRQMIPSGVLRFGAGLFGADYAPDDALAPGGSPALERSTSCRLSSGAGGLGSAAAADLTAQQLSSACLDQAGARTQAGNGTLGRGFAPPRSLKLTAGFVTQLGFFDMSLDAVVSRTQRQPDAASAAPHRCGRAGSVI